MFGKEQDSKKPKLIYIDYIVTPFSALQRAIEQLTLKELSDRLKPYIGCKYILHVIGEGEFGRLTEKDYPLHLVLNCRIRPKDFDVLFEKISFATGIEPKLIYCLTQAQSIEHQGNIGVSYVL